MRKVLSFNWFRKRPHNELDLKIRGNILQLQRQTRQQLRDHDVRKETRSHREEAYKALCAPSVRNEKMPEFPPMDVC